MIIDDWHLDRPRELQEVSRAQDLQKAHCVNMMEFRKISFEIEEPMCDLCLTFFFETVRIAHKRVFSPYFPVFAPFVKCGVAALSEHHDASIAAFICETAATWHWVLFRDFEIVWCFFSPNCNFHLVRCCLVVLVFACSNANSLPCFLSPCVQLLGPQDSTKFVALIIAIKLAPCSLLDFRTKMLAAVLL